MMTLPAWLSILPPDLKKAIARKELNRRYPKPVRQKPNPAVQDAQDSLTRFVSYLSPGTVPARHHRLLIDQLEAVERGEIKRLMVLMPPGHAKSTYASVLFPAWWVGKNPHQSMLAASYADDLAHSFGRRVRNLVGSDEFREIYGFGLSDNSKAADRWSVQAPNKRAGEQGGEYKAAGVGGAITGRRADLGLIDDPVKGREEADSATVREKTWQWYLSDFRTRLKPGAAIVLIQTRWHEDDLSGRILPHDYDGRCGWQTARDGEQWFVLSLPAIAESDNDPLGRQAGEALWPEWMSEAALEQERLSQGPRNWASLYQQRPAPLEGALFKPERIKTIESLPAHLTLVRGWDLAATEQTGANNPDWTVGAQLGKDSEGRFYIVDIVRLRGSPHEVETAVLNTASQDGRDVRLSLPQDPGQAGKAQALYFTRRLAGYSVQTSRESGPKETRAMPFASQVEAGNVMMKRAPWNDALLEEMRAFPNGVKDDQIDALSRAFEMLMCASKPMQRAHIPFMNR